MAASSVRMTKQNLENTTMHVHCIRKSMAGRGMYFLVKFPLQELRLKEAYNVSIPPHNWNLQVIRGKKNTTLKLDTWTVSTYRDSDVQCCVVYDCTNEWTSNSDVVKAVKRPWGTYEITLPANIIFHSDNAFLNGERRVVCAIQVFTSVDTQKLTSCAGTRLFGKGQLSSLSLNDPKNILWVNESKEKSSRGYDCLEEDCYLMNHLLQGNGAHSSFTDFSLRTQDGGVVEAHRSVLAVRSGFFRELLREDEKAMSAAVDFPEYLVQTAVHFMYYSQIHVDDSKVVALLLKLSVKLEIRSLEEVCADYLQRNPNLER